MSNAQAQVFDPDSFLQMTVDGANDTKYATVPSGEYFGVIEELKMPEDRKNKEGDPLYPLDITWNLIDEDAKKAAGRDKVIVRQSIFIDITANGGLDLGKGKNITLGKLREALGLNKPGFRLNDLRGAGPAKVIVIEEPDKKDPSIIRNRVTSVGKSS